MKEHRLRFPGRRITGPALAAVLLAALYGCSSESPSGVGHGFVSGQIDTILRPLAVEGVTTYSALTVTDTVDRPFSTRDVLYLGAQNGTESAILVNIDFGAAFGDSVLEEWVTTGNVPGHGIASILRIASITTCNGWISTVTGSANWLPANGTEPITARIRAAAPRWASITSNGTAKISSST